MAAIALLLATGQAAADDCRQAGDSSGCVAGPMRAADFTDAVTLLEPYGLSALDQPSDETRLTGKLVPIDPMTGVALFQNTRLVHGMMDSMEATAPFLFEVQTVGETWWGDEIRALHVRVPVESPPRPDDAERPTLLVECAMHAREWLAMESCARFVERLLSAWAYYPSQTLDFLQHVSLYVIPVANPDGRNADDNWFWSDPPVLWSSPIDHYSSGFWHAEALSGWRQNAQRIPCAAHAATGFNFGIDLARNFSRGWGSGASDCMDLQFRGEYPFQAPEAAALRRFVNNRTISMSVHVHSFGASMRGRFDDAAKGHLNAQVPIMRDGFIDWWNDTFELLSAAEPLVVRLKSDGPTGGGFGQFSAWVSDRSNRQGQLDHGTHRGVNAFVLELPPDNEAAYDGSPYDAWPDPEPGETRSFHPTGPAMIREVAPAFVRAMAFFVRQAAYPWCAIDPETFEPGSCDDIGLTGSKIAEETHGIGALEWVDTGSEAYETAPPGSYGAVYRIQSFDTGSPVTVDVEVEIASKPFTSSTYTVEQVVTTTHDLPAGGSDVGEVADSLFAYASGLDYRVTITILNDALADSEAKNDRHVFKFRVP